MQLKSGLLWIPGDGLSTAGLMCAAASAPELAGSASPGSSSSPSPNPFSEQATIRFDLPRSSEVTLAIYDSAGRHVRQWTSASLPAGPQSLSLGTEPRGALAPGTYFYAIRARGFQTAGKAVVLR